MVAIVNPGFTGRTLALALCASVALSTGLAQTVEPKPLEWGFEQRVRNENWDNIMDFNDNTADTRNQIRYRTRLWVNVPVSPNIDIFAGLNQETNQIVVQRAPYRVDEIIMDNAYIDFKKVFVKGLSLRVGRQNIIKGEGFLLLEGNPYDGSRSVYFNAVDLAYSFKKSKLELIGIDDPVRDRFLPRLNDHHKPLIEWNEQALGAYYTDKNLRNTTVEAYCFWKKEFGDTRASTNAQYQPDRHLYTAGGRAVHQLNKTWSVTGEFALQWGRQHPDTGVRGWGGYGYVKRTSPRPGHPYLLAGYWGLSGDDPKTKNTVEGWDPLFSRWPKWSELYLYTLFKEKGVAYWTNLGMWEGEAGWSPGKLGFRATYSHMGAYQPFAGSTKLYSSGLTRGDLYQGRVDFAMDKHWSGHVLWEQLLPGDFYATRNPSYFLRFEMIYAIKGAFKL